jgi:hypothetical protein
MKISKPTLAVLKNFSILNNAIVVDEEKTLKTRSPSGIIGVYDTEETFPEFAIYDLPELLNIINLFKLEDIEFNFKEKFVEVVCGKNKIRYAYTDKDLIPDVEKIKPSEKYKAFNSFDGSINLTDKEMGIIQKTSNIMGANELEIQIEDGQGKVTVCDTNSVITNNYTLDVEDAEGTFNITIGVNNLQFISGDYKISVQNDKMAKFQHASAPLFYFVPARIV